MNKLVIIGANDFQNQLILKAKEMGYETHVFAWEDGAIGKETADYFYPISIVDKEMILKECYRINPDGVCSIASDLAVITVDYVSEKLGLNSNSIECSEITTNKYKMRNAFLRNNDPSPKYLLVSENTKIDVNGMNFPLLVKPTDRSGSRGITKILNTDELSMAVMNACNESFEKKALIEEFVEGKEYSVECISFHGKHKMLAVTEKKTTGAPHFIETGHIEPASLSRSLFQSVELVVLHALNSLKITDGASHSEIMINDDNSIKIIEIGSRMGGDCIGSDLVRISTGYDFTKMVINVACDHEPDFSTICEPASAYVKFIFSKNDMVECEQIAKSNDYVLVRRYISSDFDSRIVTDSSNRYGYYIYKGKQPL